MSEKEILYKELYAQLEALLYEEHDQIANMANMSALLYHSLPKINWVGFYLFKNDELILGPFQGKVACMHIPMGKGVCGTSACKQEILCVEDVHKFPGHIACDSASRSEIVIPIVKENTLLGVLDIDSPVLARFDEIDSQSLSKLAQLLIQSL